MSNIPQISWDPQYNLATFSGPGGFTQCVMSRNGAESIATALGIGFYVSVPGTTRRPLREESDG